jgi:hypothetical protein
VLQASGRIQRLTAKFQSQNKEKLERASVALSLRTYTVVMPGHAMQHERKLLEGLSNQEFLERYARAGCIGLSGGITLIDRAICRAERHLNAAEEWGLWTHAFLFQGQRLDGHHWLIESDLQIHRKHIQLGVQENRISKYFDEALYTNLAILDFGLTEPQVALLLREGLELVAGRARYSLRELLGTMIALRRPELRGQSNLLSRDRSMYCSAMVQHVFRKAGLDLAPGVDLKHTTPEDIALTAVPHATYVLQREVVTSRRKMRKPRTPRNEADDCQVPGQ